MLAPLDLIKIRDELADLADDAIASASGPTARRDSERRYIAALAEAWKILDREVKRLASEE